MNYSETIYKIKQHEDSAREQERLAAQAERKGMYVTADAHWDAADACQARADKLREELVS